MQAFIDALPNIENSLKHEIITQYNAIFTSRNELLNHIKKENLLELFELEKSLQEIQAIIAAICSVDVKLDQFVNFLQIRWQRLINDVPS